MRSECVIYCRVSSESQTAGHGLTRQLETCMAFAKERDYKFDKEMLLDFNEKQIRLIEELEAYETQLSLRLFYAEHPELKEDQWPEVIGQ